MFHKYEAVISHLMLCELWLKRKTFTYETFCNYYNEHYLEFKKIKHPEWKYIEHCKNENQSNWTKNRNDISLKVISKIDFLLSKQK